MPAQLVPPVLTDLNNLPGFPPASAFELGTFLNSLSTTLGSGSGGVVFSPGNPNPPPGTYTTWASAMAAAQAIVGPPVWLEIDGTYAPTVVPAGLWDFRYNIFLHSPFGASTVLAFADGAQVTNLQYVSGNVALRSDSNSPVMDNTSFGILVLDKGSSVESQGTAPFISVGAGAFQVLALLDSAATNPGTAAALALNDATAACFLRLSFQTIVGLGTITGVAGSTLQQVFVATSSTFNPQAGFLGTLVKLLLTTSENSGYTAAVPGDWAGSPPDNVKTALDRIAAHLGPIP